jgi:hypothetical protein
MSREFKGSVERPTARRPLQIPASALADALMCLLVEDHETNLTRRTLVKGGMALAHVSPNATIEQRKVPDFP